MNNTIEKTLDQFLEEAYRRGYTHGIIAANNGVTLDQAYEWRHSPEVKYPPGVGFTLKNAPITLKKEYM